MLGVDEGWRTTDERTARYLNLSPGTYTLQIAARDRFGDPVGDPIVRPVVVHPFFHEPATFKMLMVLLVVFLGVGVHFLRVKQIQARFRLVQDEKARIAREVHDQLGQVFTAIGFHIDTLRMQAAAMPEGLRTIVESSREVLDTAQKVTREAIWSLRTEGSPSLRKALDKVVRAANGTRNARGTLATSGPEPRDRPVLQEELPMIAQEAITNAIRHGQASYISVELRCTLDQVRLVVRDDGTGMNTENSGSEEKQKSPTGGGWGIAGMRERAARAGGELVLSSHRGAGTEVSVVIPIEKRQ